MLKNQFEQKIQILDEAFNDEAFEEKLATRARARNAPYSTRFKRLHQAALGVTTIGLFFSGLTESICFYILLKPSLPTNNYWIDAGLMVLSGVMAGMVELLKIGVQQYFWTTLLYNRKVSGGLAVVTLALSGLSLLCSFWAASQLPNTIADAPIVENLTTIAAQYDKEIEKQNELSAQFARITWQGNLTSKGRRGIEACEARKTDLLAQRDTAVARARVRNEELLANHQNELDKEGNLLGIVTLCLEFAVLCATYYIARYYYNSELERMKIAQPTKSTKIAPAPQPQQPHAAPADTTPPAPPAHKPSFIDYENRYDNRTQIEMLEGVRECEHCGTKYVANHKKQKFCTDRCRQEHHHQKRLSNQTSLF